ncbi:hypothetical protein NDU88_005324 [Pleurodeles waltl]|uniref:Uncharacterized protein n=1 Tax=Pleurodeles waltl TaxID=8319 RepID=A0AAV7LMC4_PLEWA|nr:hypothetical protein NDU88_005324 [Pleurodeles waltl]
MLPKHTRVLRLLPERLSRLKKEIAALEKLHCNTADCRILGDIRAKRYKYHDTTQSEALHLEKYAVAQTYGEDESPDATLVVLAQPCREKDVVLEVQDEQGSPQCTTEQVTELFHKYYADLNRLRHSSDYTAATDYLEDIPMMLLKVEQVETYYFLMAIVYCFGCLMH